MATKINLTYCGMEASGATVKEAKQSAAHKIEAALAGSYAPYLMRHDDMLGFIWREPIGQYHYKIVRPDTCGRLYGNSASWIESEAKAACARHMAQNANHYGGLEQYLTARDMRELDSYFAWQARFADARARGLNDDECRAFADQR